LQLKKSKTKLASINVFLITTHTHTHTHTSKNTDIRVPRDTHRVLPIHGWQIFTTYSHECLYWLPAQFLHRGPL